MQDKGCWVAAPMTERIGRKRAVLSIIFTTYMSVDDGPPPSRVLLEANVNYSGVLLQITSTTIAQFTIGRMLCYAMTGICVNVMPAYMAECAPACLRGMMAAQLQMQIVVAQLIASAVNFAVSEFKSDVGWRTSIGKQRHLLNNAPLRSCLHSSIGIQFVMPTLLLALYPFLVESPHW